MAYKQCFYCGFNIPDIRNCRVLCTECGTLHDDTLRIYCQNRPRVAWWIATFVFMGCGVASVLSRRSAVDRIGAVFAVLVILTIPGIHQCVTWVLRGKHKGYVAVTKAGILLGRLHNPASAKLFGWSQLREEFTKWGSRGYLWLRVLDHLGYCPLPIGEDAFRDMILDRAKNEGLEATDN